MLKNTWIENNTLWTREVRWYSAWRDFPVHFDVFCLHLGKYDGHICILNFGVWWRSEGERIL